MIPMTSEWLAGWAMVFLRASGLLVVFPVFSAPSVPVQIRVALGALLAFLVSPMVPSGLASGMDMAGLIGLMAMEVGIGLLIGFVCRMVFYAVEMAGAIISTEIGLSLPPSFNPLTNSQASVPGTMLNYLATMLWLALDLHHWMLVGFQRSFALLPVGTAGLPEAVLVEVLNWAGQVFVIALQMAAPVMAVSFIISLVFAVLGRAVSQMNVFTESFAVRLFTGLLVFGLGFQLMSHQVANYLGRLPEDVLRIAAMMRVRP